MVCVGHITTASTGWSCGSCDSSVFLADNGLYQKEIIPDWPSSLNKTNPVVHHGRNFKLRNRCLRLIYSFHSIAESFIRRRSENYLCALEFELCVAFLRDLRLIPRQCSALVAREQLYTQLSQIASPGIISDVHWTMHHSGYSALNIRLCLYARTFLSLKQTYVKVLRSYVDFQRVKGN